MPNTYFQFKQFIVHQDKSAMKVCTDACLFGAWAADNVQKTNSPVRNILDIGAGTGLLSLMLAQKIEATIDAVEIDEAAAMQAKENFEASKWRERITLYKSSVQNFTTATTYDVIISNPPFFVQSLRSNIQSKNLAKHSDSLSYYDLSKAVYHLLTNDGSFYILLPFAQFQMFETIAEQNKLYLQQKVDVKQTTRHSFFRTMGVFTKHAMQKTLAETTSIKDQTDHYTSEFTNYLKDYYLNM